MKVKAPPQNPTKRILFLNRLKKKSEVKLQKYKKEVGERTVKIRTKNKIIDKLKENLKILPKKVPQENLLKQKNQLTLLQATQKQSLQKIKFTERELENLKDEIKSIQGFQKEVNKSVEQENIISLNYLSVRNIEQGIAPFLFNPKELLINESFSNSSISPDYAKQRRQEDSGGFSLDYEDNAGRKYKLNLKLNEDSFLDVGIAVLNHSQYPSELSLAALLKKAGFFNFKINYACLNKLKAY